MDGRREIPSSLQRFSHLLVDEHSEISLHEPVNTPRRLLPGSADHSEHVRNGSSIPSLPGDINVTSYLPDSLKRYLPLFLDENAPHEGNVLSTIPMSNVSSIPSHLSAPYHRHADVHHQSFFFFQNDATPTGASPKTHSLQGAHLQASVVASSQGFRDDSDAELLLSSSSLPEEHLTLARQTGSQIYDSPDSIDPDVRAEAASHTLLSTQQPLQPQTQTQAHRQHDGYRDTSVVVTPCENHATTLDRQGGPVLGTQREEQATPQSMRETPHDIQTTQEEIHSASRGSQYVSNDMLGSVLVDNVAVSALNVPDMQDIPLQTLASPSHYTPTPVPASVPLPVTVSVPALTPSKAQLRYVESLRAQTRARQQRLAGGASEDMGAARNASREQQQHRRQPLQGRGHRQLRSASRVTSRDVSALHISRDTSEVSVSRGGSTIVPSRDRNKTAPSRGGSAGGAPTRAGATRSRGASRGGRTSVVHGDNNARSTSGRYGDTIGNIGGSGSGFSGYGGRSGGNDDGRGNGNGRVIDRNKDVIDKEVIASVDMDADVYVDVEKSSWELNNLSNPEFRDVFRISMPVNSLGEAHIPNTFTRDTVNSLSGDSNEDMEKALRDAHQNARQFFLETNTTSPVSSSSSSVVVLSHPRHTPIRSPTSLPFTSTSTSSHPSSPAKPHSRYSAPLVDVSLTPGHARAYVQGQQLRMPTQSMDDQDFVTIDMRKSTTGFSQTGFSQSGVSANTPGKMASGNTTTQRPVAGEATTQRLVSMRVATQRPPRRGSEARAALLKKSIISETITTSIPASRRSDTTTSQRPSASATSQRPAAEAADGLVRCGSYALRYLVQSRAAAGTRMGVRVVVGEDGTGSEQGLHRAEGQEGEGKEDIGDVEVVEDGDRGVGAHWHSAYVIGRADVSTGNVSNDNGDGVGMVRALVDEMQQAGDYSEYNADDNTDDNMDNVVYDDREEHERVSEIYGDQQEERNSVNETQYHENEEYYDVDVGNSQANAIYYNGHDGYDGGSDEYEDQERFGHMGKECAGANEVCEQEDDSSGYGDVNEGLNVGYQDYASVSDDGYEEETGGAAVHGKGDDDVKASGTGYGVSEDKRNAADGGRCEDEDEYGVGKGLLETNEGRFSETTVIKGSDPATTAPRDIMAANASPTCGATVAAPTTTGAWESCFAAEEGVWEGSVGSDYDDGDRDEDQCQQHQLQQQDQNVGEPASHAFLTAVSPATGTPSASTPSVTLSTPQPLLIDPDMQVQEHPYHHAHDYTHVHMPTHAQAQTPPQTQSHSLDSTSSPIATETPLPAAPHPSSTSHPAPNTLPTQTPLPVVTSQPTSAPLSIGPITAATPISNAGPPPAATPLRASRARCVSDADLRIIVASHSTHARSNISGPISGTAAALSPCSPEDGFQGHFTNRFPEHFPGEVDFPGRFSHVQRMSSVYQYLHGVYHHSPVYSPHHTQDSMSPSSSPIPSPHAHAPSPYAHPHTRTPQPLSQPQSPVAHRPLQLQSSPSIHRSLQLQSSPSMHRPLQLQHSSSSHRPLLLQHSSSTQRYAQPQQVIEYAPPLPTHPPSGHTSQQQADSHIVSMTPSHAQPQPQPQPLSPPLPLPLTLPQTPSQLQSTHAQAIPLATLSDVLPHPSHHNKYRHHSPLHGYANPHIPSHLQHPMPNDQHSHPKSMQYVPKRQYSDRNRKIPGSPASFSQLQNPESPTSYSHSTFRDSDLRYSNSQIPPFAFLPNSEENASLPPSFAPLPPPHTFSFSHTPHAQTPQAPHTPNTPHTDIAASASPSSTPRRLESTPPHIHTAARVLDAMSDSHTSLNIVSEDADKQTAETYTSPAPAISASASTSTSAPSDRLILVKTETGAEAAFEADVAVKGGADEEAARNHVNAVAHTIMRADVTDNKHARDEVAVIDADTVRRIAIKGETEVGEVVTEIEEAEGGDRASEVEMEEDVDAEVRAGVEAHIAAHIRAAEARADAHTYRDPYSSEQGTAATLSASPLSSPRSSPQLPPQRRLWDAASDGAAHVMPHTHVLSLSHPHQHQPVYPHPQQHALALSQHQRLMHQHQQPQPIHHHHHHQQQRQQQQQQRYHRANAPILPSCLPGTQRDVQTGLSNSVPLRSDAKTLHSDAPLLGDLHPLQTHGSTLHPASSPHTTHDDLIDIYSAPPSETPPLDQDPHPFADAGAIVAADAPFIDMRGVEPLAAPPSKLGATWRRELLRERERARAARANAITGANADGHGDEVGEDWSNAGGGWCDSAELASSHTSRGGVMVLGSDGRVFIDFASCAGGGVESPPPSLSGAVSPSLCSGSEAFQRRFMPHDHVRVHHGIPHHSALARASHGHRHAHAQDLAHDHGHRPGHRLGQRLSHGLVHSRDHDRSLDQVYTHAHKYAQEHTHGRAPVRVHEPSLGREREYSVRHGHGRECAYEHDEDFSDAPSPRQSHSPVRSHSPARGTPLRCNTTTVYGNTATVYSHPSHHNAPQASDNLTTSNILHANTTLASPPEVNDSVHASAPPIPADGSRTPPPTFVDDTPTPVSISVLDSVSANTCHVDDIKNATRMAVSGFMTAKHAPTTTNSGGEDTHTTTATPNTTGIPNHLSRISNIPQTSQSLPPSDPSLSPSTSPRKNIAWENPRQIPGAGLTSRAFMPSSNLSPAPVASNFTISPHAVSLRYLRKPAQRHHAIDSTSMSVGAPAVGVTGVEDPSLCPSLSTSSAEALETLTAQSEVWHRSPTRTHTHTHTQTHPHARMHLQTPMHMHMSGGVTSDVLVGAMDSAPSPTRRGHPSTSPSGKPQLQRDAASLPRTHAPGDAASRISQRDDAFMKNTAMLSLAPRAPLTARSHGRSPRPPCSTLPFASSLAHHSLELDTAVPDGASADDWTTSSDARASKCVEPETETDDSRRFNAVRTEYTHPRTGKTPSTVGRLNGTQTAHKEISAVEIGTWAPPGAEIGDMSEHRKDLEIWQEQRKSMGMWEEASDAVEDWHSTHDDASLSAWSLSGEDGHIWQPETRGLTSPFSQGRGAGTLLSAPTLAPAPEPVHPPFSAVVSVPTSVSVPVPASPSTHVPVPTAIPSSGPISAAASLPPASLSEPHVAHHDSTVHRDLERQSMTGRGDVESQRMTWHSPVERPSMVVYSDADGSGMAARSGVDSHDMLAHDRTPVQGIRRAETMFEQHSSSSYSQHFSHVHHTPRAHHNSHYTHSPRATYDAISGVMSDVHCHSIDGGDISGMDDVEERRSMGTVHGNGADDKYTGMRAVDMQTRHTPTSPNADAAAVGTDNTAPSDGVGASNAGNGGDVGMGVCDDDAGMWSDDAMEISLSLSLSNDTGMSDDDDLNDYADSDDDAGMHKDGNVKHYDDRHVDKDFNRTDGSVDAVTSIDDKYTHLDDNNSSYDDNYGDLDGNDNKSPITISSSTTATTIATNTATALPVSTATAPIATTTATVNAVMTTAAATAATAVTVDIQQQLRATLARFHHRVSAVLDSDATEDITEDATYQSDLAEDATYRSDMPEDATYHNDATRDVTYRSDVIDAATYRSDATIDATYRSDVAEDATYRADNTDNNTDATYHSTAVETEYATSQPIEDAAYNVSEDATFHTSLPRGAAYHGEDATYMSKDTSYHTDDATYISEDATYHTEDATYRLEDATYNSGDLSIDTYADTTVDGETNASTAEYGARIGTGTNIGIRVGAVIGIGADTNIGIDAEPAVGDAIVDVGSTYTDDTLIGTHAVSSVVNGGVVYHMNNASEAIAKGTDVRIGAAADTTAGADGGTSTSVNAAHPTVMAATLSYPAVAGTDGYSSEAAKYLTMAQTAIPRRITAHQLHSSRSVHVSKPYGGAAAILTPRRPRAQVRGVADIANVSGATSTATPTVTSASEVDASVIATAVNADVGGVEAPITPTAYAAMGSMGNTGSVDVHRADDTPIAAYSNAGTSSTIAVNGVMWQRYGSLGAQTEDAVYEVSTERRSLGSIGDRYEDDDTLPGDTTPRTVILHDDETPHDLGLGVRSIRITSTSADVSLQHRGNKSNPATETTATRTHTYTQTQTRADTGPATGVVGVDDARHMVGTGKGVMGARVVGVSMKNTRTRGYPTIQSARLPAEVHRNAQMALYGDNALRSGDLREKSLHSGGLHGNATQRRNSYVDHLTPTAHHRVNALPSETRTEVSESDVPERDTPGDAPLSVVSNAIYRDGAHSSTAPPHPTSIAASPATSTLASDAVTVTCTTTLTTATADATYTSAISTRVTHAAPDVAPAIMNNIGSSTDSTYTTADATYTSTIDEARFTTADVTDASCDATYASTDDVDSYSAAVTEHASFATKDATYITADTVDAVYCDGSDSISTEDATYRSNTVVDGVYQDGDVFDATYVSDCVEDATYHSGGTEDVTYNLTITEDATYHSNATEDVPFPRHAPRDTTYQREVFKDVTHEPLGLEDASYRDITTEDATYRSDTSLDLSL